MACRIRGYCERHCKNSSISGDLRECISNWNQIRITARCTLSITALPYEELTFKVLYARLLALINARIQNGEFSERALARRLGISQPHLHHVLNGKRTLRASLADVVLARIHISVFDLLTAAEIAAAFEQLQSGDLRRRIYPSFNQGEAGVSKDRIRLLRKRPSTVSATPPKLEAS